MSVRYQLCKTAEKHQKDLEMNCGYILIRYGRINLPARAFLRLVGTEEENDNPHGTDLAVPTTDNE